MQASITGLNLQTFMPERRTLHGAYGEDFLTFGEFASSESPENDEDLLKIFDEHDQAVVDKFMFKFQDDKVFFSRQVNGEHKDAEIEHAIEESELSPNMTDTWTETLFYGVGNARM